MAIAQRLRPYQVEVGKAVVDSVLRRKGLTFSVEIARQGGKNELSAQLEVLLLTLFAAARGNAVKCSPTFKPQTIVSIQRLKDRLNDAGLDGIWTSEGGYMVRLGKARQMFFSADEGSHVVGATAHILLEVDESQDVSKEKYSREFKPMGASTNVTTVHYGTAWDDLTLLEEVKQTNLELERKDGVKRHFEFDWQEVAKHNPDYLRYVEGERDRLGESHPLFQTQYCLKPIHGGGGFLSETQRAQLQGTHSRQRAPSHGAVYVAGIDLAGEAEVGEAKGLTSQFLRVPQDERSNGSAHGEALEPYERSRDANVRRLKPRQDSTIVTIAELDFAHGSEVTGEPQIRVVEHYWWTGRPHTALYPKLVDLLRNVWRCRRVVVDATGVGAGVASFLEKALGKSTVEAFTFTAQSKSRLGFDFLAAVNSGRLKLYAPDSSEEHREMWHELERARSIFRANQTMGFYVDPSQGHDDFLMSLALLVRASDYRERRAVGMSREGAAGVSRDRVAY